MFGFILEKKWGDYICCFKLFHLQHTQGFYGDLSLNLTSVHLRYSALALLPYTFTSAGLWLATQRVGSQNCFFTVHVFLSPSSAAELNGLIHTASISKCMFEWSVKSRSAGHYFLTIQCVKTQLCLSEVSAVLMEGVESLFHLMRPCFYVLNSWSCGILNASNWSYWYLNKPLTLRIKFGISFVPHSLDMIIKELKVKWMKVFNNVF